jgi:hypothetical protein
MIPSFVRPFLWSYNVDKLDLSTNKRRIITNVLNLGSKEATDWLFKTFSKEDIKEALSSPLSGEWSKKSINFWGLVLGVRPGRIDRRILK